jgi:Fic family protein
MNEAVKLLHQLPSSRLIKQTHKILLQVYGEHKLPGEYRTSKTGLAEPVLVTQPLFLPFTSSINEFISDLEIFANDEISPLPDLIKIAIIHYQFETIHPF